ncbi:MULTISPECIES: hypothetical protein [Idiomarina]|jgi:hypothetical protein|nr:MULTISPECIES: hypothetical protein [Idiomarina]
MFINEWWLAWLIAPVLGTLVIGTLVIGAFIMFGASMMRHS